MWQTDLLAMLPKIYRDDPWLQTMLDVSGKNLDAMDTAITELHENRYFNGMTFALPIWERILATNARRNQTEADRQAALRAKWLTSLKTDLDALKAIVDSWTDSNVDISYPEADRLHLTFIEPDGVPHDLAGMYQALREIAPAHIPFTAERVYENGSDGRMQIVGVAKIATKLLIRAKQQEFVQPNPHAPRFYSVQKVHTHLMIKAKEDKNG